tara:strand:- start:68 stop:856 length:789 start_codon:yes stop_codon:yes gene_type:complete
MKIDRVIFCLNSNPLFDGFWNSFSRVWRKKFNIVPTLFFSGSEEDLEKANLSNEFGDVIRIDPVPEVVVDHGLDWSITWSFFWGPTLFPDEVCMTSGMDQLPLSHIFFKTIASIPNDDYVVGFSDAYTGTDHFPSSHHVSKGKNFQKIYNIDASWEKEVKKVFEKGKVKFKDQLDKNLWALDEVYSSRILKDFMKTSPDKVHLMKGFWSDWHPRRICRSRDNEYSKDSLKNGEYTELHSPRPYTGGNKIYIDTLIKDLLSNE